ncbi:MAG: hypothetical protein AAF368_05120, partial [Planctomycetota bacterium]
MIFRSLLRTLLRKQTGNPDYRLDPALRENDASSILWSTGLRVLRGFTWKLRTGSSRGLLFVDRRTRITHARHLHVGRNVKFEEGCEVQCLALRGVHLGDGVTVGRNASIRPSSYYGHELGEGLRVGDRTAIGALSW